MLDVKAITEGISMMWLIAFEAEAHSDDTVDDPGGLPIGNMPCVD